MPTPKLEVQGQPAAQKEVYTTIEVGVRLLALLLGDEYASNRPGFCLRLGKVELLD